ncbi:MAG: MBL fold metallo-hydrolase [Chitinophagaceae bacterium]|nr:MBL fold metallo-hydrolase [Chitinophagaceae bacterium]
MLTVKVFTFSPIQENTYVLFNEQKACIIIDPGCYDTEEQEALRSFIDKNGLLPKMLLNTHCHLDHVFGNKFIAEAYGLTLNLHEAEKAMLQMAPASGLMFNLPFDNYSGEFIILKEGNKIVLGKDELEIIHAPGHSPGSICFYCRAQNFIIGGDVLFYDSIGRTDLPGGDHQTLVNSIQQKIFALPDDTKVYSGHGAETNIGREKKHNPFVGENARSF